MRILLNLSRVISSAVRVQRGVQRVAFRYHSTVIGDIVWEHRLGINVKRITHKAVTARHFCDFPLTDLVYERLSSSTLDELAFYFEELPEFGRCPEDYDVQYGNGVLTIKVGGDIGTYVINKQSPNKQIWLSSPVSGPKRYDLINGYWTYHHDNSILHDLLSREFTEHLDSEVDLTKLENYHRLADGDAWS